MTSNSTKLSESIRRFWFWFVESQNRLAKMAPDLACEEIQTKIRDVDTRLDVEVGEGHGSELVVTTHGIAEVFPLAELLAGAVPSFVNWTITALKPPRGFDFHFQVDSVRIHAADIAFEVLKAKGHPDILGLRIYLPKQQIPSADWAYLARVILENGLGEAVSADIRHIEIADISEAPENSLHLQQLSAFLKWRENR